MGRGGRYDDTAGIDLEASAVAAQVPADALELAYLRAAVIDQLGRTLDPGLSHLVNDEGPLANVWATLAQRPAGADLRTHTVWLRQDIRGGIAAILRRGTTAEVQAILEDVLAALDDPYRVLPAASDVPSVFRNLRSLLPPAIPAALEQHLRAAQEASTAEAATSELLLAILLVHQRMGPWSEHGSVFARAVHRALRRLSAAAVQEVVAGAGRRAA